MRDCGKRNVLGVEVNAVDYDAAIAQIVLVALARRGIAVSALAVHGVMTGVLDPVQRHRLNRFGLVVPDGQPVRWALNLLYDLRLEDRVYGPNLMLRVCDQAARLKLPIYLYGSRQDVLDMLRHRLGQCFPDLVIAGAQPSRFRRISPDEKRRIIGEIRESGAAITFVGLGCPRQEIWAYEYVQELSMPVLAVGAAFEFHAGTQAQAPDALQRRGLEWLFRLIHEPRRLWRRYLYLNPLYVGLVALQALGAERVFTRPSVAPQQEVLYG